MDITYLGHSSFKIRGKKISVVTDPFDPEMVGLKYPRLKGDIVTVSHNHQDHNRSDLVKGVKKILDSPGEYEIMEVSVIGISTLHDSKKGSLRGKNIIFIIDIDGISLAHLGDLGHKPTESQLELLEDVDVLMVPVGGEYTIGPTLATEIVQDVGAKVILPMHYNFPGLNQKEFSKLASIDLFLSEVGLPVEKLNKLSLKKETLGEDQMVVVLNIV
jgi:L-ascorbate metabolism protein UlaG (beta-lactamase superfamily)